LSDPRAELVRSARELNKGMPDYSVNLVNELTGDIRNKKILVLGVGYRSGVKESAFSGVFDLVKELSKRGGLVCVWDPLYTATEVVNLGLIPFDGAKSSIDLVFLQTDDPEFLVLLNQEFSSLKCIFDGRNMFKGVSPITGVRIIALGLSHVWDF
jgi:UDP-N-acetyl-D-mannosaminuronate dehydrogenase